MKHRIKCSLISVVLSGMAATALAQSNIYVATNGDDAANSGQSWASPYATISNGIAKAPTAGDTVWVSNGAYVLSAQLSIANAITVSAWSANAANTIIDGGYPARTGRCVNISAAATLAGFTISNGMAEGSDGGGIYLQNSSCMVTNCIITLNQANSSNASDYGRGGGIFINSSGGRVSDCLFSNNLCVLTQAIYVLYLYGGGGIYCDGYARISNCRFVTNVVSKTGGDGFGGGLGISSRSGLNCIASNCTFYMNRSSYGGGIGAAGSSAGNSIRIIDSAVSNNYGGYGGGVWAQYCVVSNCVMERNQSGTGQAGMYLAAGATGVNCVVRENLANGYECAGVGVHGGSLLLNSSVINNTNLSGGWGHVGGVFLRGTTSRSILRNCLIAGNVVTNTYGVAGVSHHSTDGTNSVVQNCTIVFNRANPPGTGSGGGVVLSTNSFGHYGNIIYYNTGTYVDNWNYIDYPTMPMSNTCITPTNSNLIGTGNITNAPLLIDTNSANYRLAKGSPCINTGLNQDWMIPPGSGGTVDLDGRMRRRYGTVDIGAYEAVYSAFIFTAY